MEGESLPAHFATPQTYRLPLPFHLNRVENASLRGASISSPGSTRRPYVLVWVIGSQGNWAIRYKSVAHIDQVKVMADSQTGFLAFMPSEVAEVLWAFLVVGTAGWVVWRASIMMS